MAAKTTPTSKRPPTSQSARAVEAKDVRGIRVHSFSDTFRRAGIEFTREGVDLRLDSLTDDQIKAISEEPMLRCTGVDLPDDNDSRNALDESDDGDSDSNGNGNGNGNGNKTTNPEIGNA